MADKDNSALKMPALDPEALARAEQAVAALGSSFVEKLKSDLVEIRTVADALAQSREPGNNSSIETIYSFAHDMTGQGGSFGYPLLSKIGSCLSDFLEQRGSELRQSDIPVLKAHLDTAAAIISSTVNDDDDSTSRALIDGLETLVQKRLNGQC